MESEFRRLPSVDKVLSHEGIKALLAAYPHELVVDMARQSLDNVRLSISNGKACPSMNVIVKSIRSLMSEIANPSLRPVINAGGVILNTNLGRAPLSQSAMEAMDVVSKGYCNLEIDLDTGARGSRNVHVERLLCQLSGAEAALVVNNNAAAVLLVLTALAKRKEVIVSRGQAVEIGGGFRIPDVMRQSGAKLVEVGTTNCTYIHDYEEAITARTAALLRVHPSNFQVEGFANVVSLEEMVALGERYAIPVLDDLGSGSFMDTAEFGLSPEPTVQQSINSGVDLACFSGDKLLGGPQAGIIVGKKAIVDKLKRHPLARAVRIGKIRLAGLAATLLHYVKDEALEEIPVWRMISMPLAEVEKRAMFWARALGNIAEVVDGESMIGGGSLPGNTLPTKLVAIGKLDKGASKVHLLARKLRTQEISVIGRVSGDVLFLDPRTVLPEEDATVIGALKDAIASIR